MPLAKLFYKQIATFTLILMLIMSAATFIFRRQIAEFFTDDIAVVKTTSILLIFKAETVLFDGLLCYMQGVIRALGLQKMTSFIALALYWLLGIPLAALFAFSFDWGVLGMNSGLAVANIGQGFACLTIVYYQDW